MCTKVRCATDGKNCDNCIYSSTDGFFAPSLWCNKDKPYEDRDGISAGAYEKMPLGSICDDYQSDHGLPHIKTSTPNHIREDILTLIKELES